MCVGSGSTLEALAFPRLRVRSLPRQLWTGEKPSSTFKDSPQAGKDSSFSTLINTSSFFHLPNFLIQKGINNVEPGLASPCNYSREPLGDPSVRVFEVFLIVSQSCN